MYRSQHKVTRIKKKQVDIAQSKEQNKSPETDPKEREVYDVSDKELKITIIKILNRLKKMMHEQKENINEEKI